MKFCPKKFSRPTPDDWGCEGSSCAWWVESLGECAIAIQPNQIGREIERKEMQGDNRERDEVGHGD